MKHKSYRVKRNLLTTFMRVLCISILTLGSIPIIQAQVTIGSGIAPDDNALLDLKEENVTTKGLLLPRVSLSATDSPSPLSDHVEGMFVFNTVAAGAGTTAVTKGIYYNTGSHWQKIGSAFTNWFYMPSTIFDTSIIGNNLTKNLYQLYVNQFTNPKYKSQGAPSALPYLPNADDLYYYITDYDQDVFEIVSLTDEGILTYNVKQAASAYSLINIIFVLK